METARDRELGTSPRAADEPGPAILSIVPRRDLTFVAQDVAILSRAYPVEVVAREDHASLTSLLWAVVSRLRSRRYGLLYVWFAEPYDSLYLVLAARAFGVRSAVVVGGYEVTALPDLQYGGLRRATSRLKVRGALRLADAVFPTSDLLASEVGDAGGGGKVRVIYPGIDVARFAPREPREPLVVTIATVGRDTWKLKGLDVFARCSRLVPGVDFLVVGPCTDRSVLAELRRMGGENLRFSERRLAPDEIAAVLSRAKVYAQLSARESFGVALAEAMSAGCVPVAAATGFMPEIVGDAGCLVEYGQPDAAAACIARALAEASGTRFRRRIQERFPIERRRRELLVNVGRLMAS